VKDVTHHKLRWLQEVGELSAVRGMSVVLFWRRSVLVEGQTC